MTFTIITKTKYHTCDVADLIITAVEGGSAYWCKELTFDPPANYQNVSTYADPNRTITVVPHEDEPVTVQLTNERITEAFRSLKLLRPKFKMLDFDADDADCFLQYLVFGKIVYG